MPTIISEFAPAKVNLTLRVLGRLADGYHELESLVAFADVGDELALTLGQPLDLELRGPEASALGPSADNLVLKAARALAERVEGLSFGRFVLTKHLPVAAGLGGGSADAAAALRLLARANGLTPDDPRLVEAARATGADVPICLDPRPRVMRGIGEVLSDPIDFPRIHAVLVNPGVPLATKDVFAAVRLTTTSYDQSSAVPENDHQNDWLNVIMAGGNDLEPAAISLQPVIADVLARIRQSEGCRVARMSGSGATCFGVFRSAEAAASFADTLAAVHPAWWIRPTVLG